MPRGSRHPSDVFRAVLESAKHELLVGDQKAAAFAHKGIRGDERAASLAKFLREHLPDSFAVGKGEVIDYLDARTGQLDIVVYDQTSCVPISVQSENLLLPCEALYLAIEVKTTVTQQELNKSLVAAGKVRRLRPFKGSFVAPRKEGLPVNDDSHRCMYLIFGYGSDLSNNSDWLAKEYSRLALAATSSKVSIDCVDHLIVLDRGIIHPAATAGKWDVADGTSIFLETYLHIVNFLNRESRRRPPVDWQTYGPKTAAGWKPIRVNAATSSR